MIHSRVFLIFLSRAKRVTLYLPSLIFNMIPDNLRSYLYEIPKHFMCVKFFRANTAQTPSKQQDAHVCYYKQKLLEIETRNLQRMIVNCGQACHYSLSFISQLVRE